MDTPPVNNTEDRLPEGADGNMEAGNRRPKSANSREKVVQAATELFGTRGFGKTSVEDILKSAGVAKSNFYYHFASKEALGMEVLKRMQEDMQRDVWPTTFGNSGLTPLKRIEGFINCIMETLARNDCHGGCPFANLAIEVSDDMKDFREELTTCFQAVVGQMAACVRQGQERGEMRADLDPHLTAQLLFAQLEGSVLLAKTYKDIAPIRESFATMVTLLRV